MILRVALIFGAAVAWTACVHIDEFHGGASDGGSDDRCKSGTAACLADIGGKLHAEVYGRYDLTFSDTGFHFPESLHSASLELLGAPPDACSAEKGAGVAISPATVISSVQSPDTGSTIDSAVITQMIPGPGIAKVAIDWQAALANCGASPHGRSTFTFFPDGRITRMDLIHADTGALDPMACSCQNEVGSVWQVASYWSLALANVDPSTAQGFMGTIPTDNGNEHDISRVVCVAGPGHTLGLAIPESLPTPHVRAVGPDFSLIADAIVPQDTSMSPHDSSTSMYITTSPDEDCTSVQTYLTPFSKDLQLEVEDAGGMYSRGLGDDGIYGGEFVGMEGTGGFGFQGNQLKVRPFNGVTLPAFALWLDVPELASVTRTPASQLASWYEDQSVASTQHILWFPEGLQPGQEIVIEVVR